MKNARSDITVGKTQVIVVESPHTVQFVTGRERRELCKFVLLSATLYHCSPSTTNEVSSFIFSEFKVLAHLFRSEKVIPTRLNPKDEAKPLVPYAY